MIPFFLPPKSSILGSKGLQWWSLFSFVMQNQLLRLWVFCFTKFSWIVLITWKISEFECSRSFIEFEFKFISKKKKVNEKWNSIRKQKLEILYYKKNIVFIVKYWRKFVSNFLENFVYEKMKTFNFAKNIIYIAYKKMRQNFVQRLFMRNTYKNNEIWLMNTLIRYKFMK